MLKAHSKSASWFLDLAKWRQNYIYDVVCLASISGEIQRIFFRDSAPFCSTMWLIWLQSPASFGANIRELQKLKQITAYPPQCKLENFLSQ